MDKNKIWQHYRLEYLKKEKKPKAWFWMVKSKQVIWMNTVKAKIETNYQMIQSIDSTKKQKQQ